MKPLSVISRHSSAGGTSCSASSAATSPGRSRFIRSRAEMFTDTCSRRPSRSHSPHWRTASRITQRVSSLM